MFRPSPDPSTLYQSPPTPPSTPSLGFDMSAYDGMDDVLPALIAFDLECVGDPSFLKALRFQSGLTYLLGIHFPAVVGDGGYARATAVSLTSIDATLSVTELQVLYDDRHQRLSINCLTGRGLYNDKRLSLYPQVSQILHRLQESQTHIAAISRTSSPELYVPLPISSPLEQPLPSILAPSAISFGVRNLTQIPYSSMLFFAGDTTDYASNLEVQKLGVTFVPIVDHEKGLTERRFEEGIKMWRERRRERASMSFSTVIPGVDDGSGRRSCGRNSSARQAEEKREREDRMNRRPVPPHSHHSDGTVSRQQQQNQNRTHQQQQQQQQRNAAHANRTHLRPLQLQHRWNSESRQWEIVNTQQHYSTLRSPTSPSPKERPWTADPMRLSPWSGGEHGTWLRAESEPPVAHHHHHSVHVNQQRGTSPGFGNARDVVWTPPMSVSSPELDEEDEEDEEDDDDSEGSQASGSTRSNW
ncbi:hypothetical protein FRB90_006429 [Tulasnella sp. 427]|nr:hypothetical protein FRB90_006429 [Tulasnella sp. 427]